MRPLAFLDLETTGVNIATDAIVTMGLHCPEWPTQDHLWTVKPWKPIPDEVVKLIGITNEAVAREKPFSYYAPSIYKLLTIVDLAGFNLRQFDIPLLWEELYRCGIEWDLSSTLIVDAGTIFKIREERTLTAAMQFYCKEAHDGAHGALEDCRATRKVLEAQLVKYQDLGKLDRTKLALASNFEGPQRLSLDGKVCLDAEGEAIFTFGKHRETNTRVRDDQGYAEWMLKADFPAQTKLVLRKLIDQYDRENEARDDRHIQRELEVEDDQPVLPGGPDDDVPF